MKLPPGATGFNPRSSHRADSIRPIAACHHAARAIGATVTGVTRSLRQRTTKII
ncbi:hypothetical protein [Micromonospora sp. NPDC005206]|uniref:hypothetical protein n=1 Tax=Micromonospora sp. NPDC005206 TaxID=3157022 RepID=UPI0033BDF83B